MVCSAVIFDYIGTLVNCRNYSMDASRVKLHSALVCEGFSVEKDEFFKAYNLAHEKYRRVRYEQLREVTNAVWVSEALCSLGYKVSPDDKRVCAALNVFFEDFIDTLELREGAKNLVSQASVHGKVGLISNFTHAPVIYKSLRKIGISKFFNAIVVSEEHGWRKPSGCIFEAALNMLQTQPSEAVFIGDNPVEDIKGANNAGLKTVFVPSQFNTLEDLQESKVKPTHIASDLKAIAKNLSQILST